MANNKFTASDARSMAEASEKQNLDMVFVNIESVAKTGNRELLCFNYLSIENVKTLMDHGFTVSKFFHQLEQREIYRISW